MGAQMTSLFQEMPTLAWREDVAYWGKNRVGFIWISANEPACYLARFALSEIPHSGYLDSEEQAKNWVLRCAEDWWNKL